MAELQNDAVLLVKQEKCKTLRSGDLRLAIRTRSYDEGFFGNGKWSRPKEPSAQGREQSELEDDLTSEKFQIPFSEYSFHSSVSRLGTSFIDIHIKIFLLLVLIKRKPGLSGDSSSTWVEKGLPTLLNCLQ